MRSRISPRSRAGHHPGRRAPAAAAVALLTAVTGAGLVTAVGAAPAQADPTPATTLVVNADKTLRPVTHVATGSLYGLADAATPSDDLVAAIKPNTFVQMPVGGHQQPTGDILKVAQKAATAGAKVVNRLSDYYAGWPYQFSWDNWLNVVDQQIELTSGIPNLAAYEL